MAKVVSDLDVQGTFTVNGLPVTGSSNEIAIQSAEPGEHPDLWVDTDDDITAYGVNVLPSGGTTGQVLSKNSGTDYDVEWADSGAISNTIVAAKGDIITATANDTPAIQGVGSNGQVLVANSGAANGIEWAYSQIVTTNAQSDSYTLVLSDAGKTVEMGKATAQDLTVPLNSSVAFPVGTRIDIIQTGAGQVTVVATGGVTVNAKTGLKLSGQWAAATLIKRGTDLWVLIGSLSA